MPAAARPVVGNAARCAAGTPAACQQLSQPRRIALSACAARTHLPLQHSVTRPLARCRRSFATARPVRAASRRNSQIVCAQAGAELPPNLKKIVTSFQMVPDPKARYKQLLFFAAKLQPMAAEDHTDDNKVTGCVSQVWVKPELREGKVFWAADSDSQLTKGLAALLVQGLSDCTPEEIVALDADFIEALGLKQSLTPSRNNGFLNMLRLMQKKSLQLMASA
mmetsp:Transcript_3027/g.7740  ORF Transcript_3027/g.7740 Transcript_3027/m.7740 type:complete len:222 (-) Transcript_3027:110-775(-)